MGGWVRIFKPRNHLRQFLGRCKKPGLSAAWGSVYIVLLLSEAENPEAEHTAGGSASPCLYSGIGSHVQFSAPWVCF